MSGQPLVSVIMPFFNAEAYIGQALQSVCQQTYQNIEIIVVDDASTDASLQLVNAIPDPRIKIIQNETNLGLAASLNKALAAASGPLIARMDADDICLPQRLTRQVAFMQQHPTVSVVGTALQYFQTSWYTNYFPVSHEQCRAKLLFNVCFGHPSIMFRQSVLAYVAGYNEALRQYSEDYDLYERLADHVTFANLREVLVRYRTFPSPAKQEAELLRKQNSYDIRKRLLKKVGIPEDQLDMEAHTRCCHLARVSSLTELDVLAEWLAVIFRYNEQTNYLSRVALAEALTEQLFFLAYHNPQLNARLSRYSHLDYVRPQAVGRPLKLRYWLKKIVSSLR